MQKTITIIAVLAILGFIILKVSSAPKDSVNNTIDNNTYTATSTSDTSTTTVNTTNTTNTIPENTGSTKTSVATKQYTMAQVATHKDASSCWTAVRNNVYDLTSFITEHPGGAENILKLCGKDGTEAFEQKHGGRPRQEQELAGHEIGVLVK